MDYFKVTAAWAERDFTSGYIRYKFRFEKRDSNKLGWWASHSELDELEHSNSSRPLIDDLQATCISCKKASYLVFEVGFVCLNTKCSVFWKVGTSWNLGSGSIAHQAPGI